MDRLNYIAYMDGHHRYMFDEENLLRVLVQAGFADVAAISILHWINASAKTSRFMLLR
jgi:hypothetical protein